MKIYSKFKDYYDVGMRLDADPAPRYLRNERTVKFGKSLNHGPQHPVGPNSGYSFILFCGKKYPYFKFAGEIYFTPLQIINKINCMDRVGQHTYANTLTSLSCKRMVGPSGHKWDRWGLSLGTWRWYAEHHANIPVDDSVHLKYGSPIIIVDGDNVTLDARLSQYNFQSAVDPYTACQELAMYLGNQMADTAAPPAPMTDALKIHSHGFDQWSFRTHKADSKKNQRVAREPELPPAKDWKW